MPKIEIRPLLIAPVLAFVFAMLLAILAGLFLGLFGGIFITDADETTILFDIAFIALFVLPAYVLCGVIASLLATARPHFHAALAGFVYLLASLAMALPSNPEDPFGWSDAICFAAIVPLSLLGAKIGGSFQ